MAPPPARNLSEFERTCLPWLGEVQAFALSLTRRPADADDLVQETFLKALRSFDGFQRGTNAKAWLFTIARRLLIDRYRRQRIRPQPLAEEALEDTALTPAAPEVDGAAWERIAPETVRAAIEAVPEPFRTAVVLRDMHGLSYQEVAQVLDVPAGTVMSRLNRGREYVRAALVDRLKDPS
jgi:RNA polymerase sigma-70 factor (ECF subfamily)